MKLNVFETEIAQLYCCISMRSGAPVGGGDGACAGGPTHGCAQPVDDRRRDIGGH